jgi:hypothetical protein
MNLTDVMEEIADKLRMFTGLNVFDYPCDEVTPPAAILSYPESIDYDQTYDEGTVQFSGMTLYMVTDRADSKSARIQMSHWTNTSGPQSIKRFLDTENYTSCDAVHLGNATFDVMRVAGIDYLVGIFTFDVQGDGE